MHDGSHDTIRRKVCIQFEISIRQDTNAINPTAGLLQKTKQLFILIFMQYEKKQSDKTHMHHGTKGVCRDS